MTGEEKYRAIAACDAACDGLFYYGVVTTGIYCRPSCPSRTPKRENLRFFASREEAEAAGQLAEYFSGSRREFHLPLRPRGSGFQQRVWQALQQIPYGQTRSYGQIAEAIGAPKAARAVGLACNRNPLLILIPCHRVVGRDGRLVGYAGGLDRKERLLSLEARTLG